MKLRSLLCTILFLLLVSQKVLAVEPFVIKDIKVEGLQRISLGTVFTYLPLKVGETLDGDRSTEAIRALFKTGFFEDVWFSRDGDVLVIHVVERPSISSLKIFGNKEINTEDLTKALKDIGLAEGRVFNRSLLDQVEQELHRQYFALGNYGVKIKSTVNKLKRNRVDVELDIDEGEPARIRQIKIIGAEKFKEQDLLDKLELSMPTMFSGISGSDKYSKQTLVGDLERLRSFYLDRGYINFNIDSTQVSISPDKQDVYITINITEGDQFVIKDITLAGNLIIPRDEIEKLISLKPGDIFSRQRVIDSTSAIVDRLGVDGYAFANVNPIPKINQEKKEVALSLFIDPGNRVYVRRINIIGNTKTKDEVIRRELRQMEGGWISTPLVNRSKVRLQRLGYFEEVKVDTPTVPGTTDQVDVNFDVVEGSTGTFTAGLGYGSEGGFLLNASVALKNYLGTGKRVRLEVNKNDISKVYSFSYTNPYYTLDGVSRGFSIYSRSTDQSQANLADFTTDKLGANVNFGIPLTEYTSAHFGLGVEDTDITINRVTAPDYYDQWVEKYGNQFLTYTASLSHSFDTRDRVIFPESGILSRISAEVAFPGGDLEYYKASYDMKSYFDLGRALTLMAGGQLAYGDAYGGTDDLPFFENYYTGGIRSVRGFRSNTIGPKGINCRTVTASDGMGGTTVSEICEPDQAVGGNAKFEGRLELFISPSFDEQPNRNFRFSTFIDFARVYNNVNDPSIIEDNRLRASYGLGAVWITPVGALTFSLAWPIVDYAGDETEVFGFNIGAPF
ncbi:MAG: outer membrane protein assembly factor BamA [Gammaproteobacteria bacterium]|jgi:outer membrane protein insertion porin family